MGFRLSRDVVDRLDPVERAIVLDRLVRVDNAPVWPGAGLVLGLVGLERSDDLPGLGASAQCSAESESREINPLIEVVRVLLDLIQLLAAVVEDPGWSLRTERALNPLTLSLQVGDVDAGHQNHTQSTRTQLSRSGRAISLAAYASAS